MSQTLPRGLIAVALAALLSGCAAAGQHPLCGWWKLIGANPHEFAIDTDEGMRCFMRCDAFTIACGSGCFNLICRNQCYDAGSLCAASCPGVRVVFVCQ